MNWLQKKWVIIVIVLFIALFLRIYNIDNNPPGLTPDEAALGYNAYSILKTGRDEQGAFLPIIFKSFGDYKPGLYVYLDVPFVAAFGLNEFSTRLPSVIAGVISVALVYLIVKQLFKDERLALIATLVAATNPWLIYFSRGAWEVNICLTLTLAGIYFFFKSLHNSKFIIYSSFFFALTLIDYQGAKLSTAIVVAILCILYWKDILKIKFKYLTTAIIFGLIISAPIIISLFSGQSGRLNVFSVFSYRRPPEYLQAFLSEGNIKKGSIVYDLFYNEPLNFLRGILTRFSNHFSGRFLFFEGDWSNLRQSPPYQGELVIGDAVFLAIGVVALLRRKLSKEVLFVLLWLLLATLPAILSRDQVHAVRSFNLVIPLITIISFGINEFVASRGKKIFLVIIFVVYAGTYVYFLDSLFVHLPVHDSELWQYGYKQMVADIVPIAKNYKNVVIQQSYNQPYIYFLYYGKYDPSKWQQQSNFIASSAGDVGLVGKLDNITFKNIDWSAERGDHGALIVADPIVIPPSDSNDPKLFKLVDEIKYLNGKTAWRILEVR